MMRQETDRHKKTFYVTVGKCKLKMSYTILFYFLHTQCEILKYTNKAIHFKIVFEFYSENET